MSLNEDFGINLVISSLYFLALINPISKVCILSVFSPHHTRSDFVMLIRKSSIAAFLLLLGAMIGGDFMLRSVFRIELYSLRVAGGLVLSLMGFRALRHGVFYEAEEQKALEEMSIVPLGCPMITGPATIAACITAKAQDGVFLTMSASLIAIMINYLIMYFSSHISVFLIKFNMLGAVIRLTGLIVMSIGVQMVFDGTAFWLKNICS